MVATLEAIKGGGGSIKVGTTGKIGALMSRELEPAKPTTQTPATTRNKFLLDSNVVSNDPMTPRRLKPRTPMGEASSSGSSSSTINERSPETVRKTKHYDRKTRQVPMLDSDNVSTDGTPVRGKPGKRGSYNIVELVDIKCGSPDRTWTGPITNRLKKLSFSKLSESIV